MPASLIGCDEPPASSFDVALLDLDGVVYVGKDAVPGAAAALSEARSSGMRLAFVTNNAARPPSAVAEHLTALGVPAEVADVTTSAQAAAHYLADRLPAGAAVLVVGTTGLYEALTERGLTPVSSADEDPQTVVQGYSPELDWSLLAEGAVAIRAGVPWVATNLDITVPSSRGPLPGNGSMVAALRTATGVTPVSTGKPDPTMHRESVLRSGAQRPIVVGDRLDTDIEGATRVGCASLLVLSGVTTPAVLVHAEPDLRPDLVAHDVRGLLHAHAAPVEVDGGVRCGRWQVRVDGTCLQLAQLDPQHPTDGGSTAADDLDPLRALCAAAWRAVDALSSEGGSEPQTASDNRPRWTFAAVDDAAAAALRALQLD